MTATRLSAIASHLTPGIDEKWEKLPTFDELPNFHDHSGCAWEVWGKGDQLGTVNLLTPEVVKEAAKEIKIGRTVSLNWPIQFPEKPVFGRKTPEAIVIRRIPTTKSRDDEISMNTQSGSQWDGLKHCGIPLDGSAVFYQNTPSEELKGGRILVEPDNVDQNEIKLGIHNWSQHGINGRGVLLDLVRYYTKDGHELPYDPWATHGFLVADLETCAKEQGVSFRKGDILLLRVGFIEKYYTSGQEQKDLLPKRTETFAGIEQSEDMKRFLWNNHFAAVASDQPALERWPAPKGMQYLHETLLTLWGMPIGEFFDLELLSAICAETNRYTFFFTSTPLNVLGGVASPPNAAAYF